MRILFLIVTLAITGFGVLAQDVPGNSCKVSGTLRDLQDAVVPNQTVWFRDGDITRKIKTDGHGKYALTVDSGKHEVLIGGQFNFWNYRRGILNVSCDADIQLNLYMTPECVSYGCTRLGSHFDFFSLKPSMKSGMDMVIAYDSRKKKAGKFVYTRAVLTTNVITVLAEEIDFHADTSTLVARDGWIEIEGSRSAFSILDLETKVTVPKSKPRTLCDRENIKHLKSLYENLSKPSKVIAIDKRKL